MPNTVTLNYSDSGQGTPVVLLHGFPLSGAIWHEQQQRLSEHYRVITCLTVSGPAVGLEKTPCSTVRSGPVGCSCRRSASVR